jgi:hypothetical protein
LVYQKITGCQLVRGICDPVKPVKIKPVKNKTNKTNKNKSHKSYDCLFLRVAQ